MPIYGGHLCESQKRRVPILPFVLHVLELFSISLGDPPTHPPLDVIYVYTPPIHTPPIHTPSITYPFLHTLSYTPFPTLLRLYTLYYLLLFRLSHFNLTTHNCSDVHNIEPLRAHHFLVFLRDVVNTGTCGIPFLEATIRAVQNTAYHVNIAAASAAATAAASGISTPTNGRGSSSHSRATPSNLATTLSSLQHTSTHPHHSGVYFTPTEVCCIIRIGIQVMQLLLSLPLPPPTPHLTSYDLTTTLSLLPPTPPFPSTYLPHPICLLHCCPFFSSLFLLFSLFFICFLQGLTRLKHSISLTSSAINLILLCVDVPNLSVDGLDSEIISAGLIEALDDPLSVWQQVTHTPYYYLVVCTLQLAPWLSPSVTVSHHIYPLTIEPLLMCHQDRACRTYVAMILLRLVKNETICRTYPLSSRIGSVMGSIYSHAPR